MIWKSEQCCVLMSNGRGVGCVQRLPGNRSWPQSVCMYNVYATHYWFNQSSVYYCVSDS